MKIEIRRRGLSDEIYDLYIDGEYVANSDCISDLSKEADLIKSMRLKAVV